MIEFKRIFSSKIKTRIVLFFVLFEIVAIASIQVFYNYSSQNELLKIKNQEIQQAFARSTQTIKSLTRLMENNVTRLAFAGEYLFGLKQTNVFDLEQVKRESKRLLTNEFSAFPEAIGGGIWFEPYLLDKDVELFGPYIFKNNNSLTFTWDLSTTEYDYPNQDWYQVAKQANWGVEQQAYRSIFWTAPYYDDAGTFTLMMTVEAVMKDQQGQPIGLATVDWALSELTNVIDNMKLTPDSSTFFIHEDTGKFVSIPSIPELNMQPINVVDWTQGILSSGEVGVLNQLEFEAENDELYKVYFYRSDHGFIFGSLTPEYDLLRKIKDAAKYMVVVGVALATGFIILLLLLLNWVFSPFDKVLKLIEQSVTERNTDASQVRFKQLQYGKENEFTPIILALNKIYILVSEYVDTITDRNRELEASEHKIKKLNDELEQKVDLRTKQLADKTTEAVNSLEQLQATQQHLIQQEKHAALGKLVAGVAHEINTPLGISVTAASTIEARMERMHSDFNSHGLRKSEFEATCQEITEMSSILLSNLQRASDLIVAFKQVSVDQSSDQLRKIDLADYIQKVIRSLKPKLKQTSHVIDYLSQHEDIEVEIFPGALAQIITNIVDNALTHGLRNKRNGLIKIESKVESNSIILHISDDGAGMPGEVLKCIFDPFFTTARHVGGSGLGMHLVHNLVTQQLKGNIECESQLGKGTFYRIIFPASMVT